MPFPPRSRPIPSTTGRANFGFVSKYLPGRQTPDGSTEFRFQMGNLNFHSNDQIWLVIAGYKAQYRGTGTVNGAAGYNFLLTAYDGDLMTPRQADKFRIKITTATGGTVIYDNRIGASDDIDSANPEDIAQGSIVIHSSNQTAAGAAGRNLGLAPLTMAQLQPVWAKALRRWEAAGATPKQLARLANTDVQIAALPADRLGRTVFGVNAPNTIWFSPDAAGHGWFVDPRPGTDLEFDFPGSPAANRMDLLSVVAHEMGHIILNMDESSAPNNVMTEALPEGVRRLPTPADLGKVEVIAAQSVDSTLAVASATVTAGAPAEVTLNLGSSGDTDAAVEGAWLNLALSQAASSPRSAPAAVLSQNVLDHVLSQLQATSPDDGPVNGLAWELVR